MTIGSNIQKQKSVTLIFQTRKQKYIDTCSDI